MKTKILVLLIAVLPLLAMSQENTTGKETPYIEVVGTGEMEIIPDQIYISFTLKERFEGKKKIELEDQEKEMKKRLMKLDIDLKDLQLADANSDFITIKRKKTDVIASKDYLLKVSTTGTLAKVFELLDEINAFNADIQRVVLKKKQLTCLSALAKPSGNHCLFKNANHMTNFNPCES